MISLTATAVRAERDRNDVQFRAIFAICLPACFCAAAVRRLDPNFWLGRGPQRSLLGETWAAAGTVARFALAG